MKAERNEVFIAERAQASGPEVWASQTEGSA